MRFLLDADTCVFWLRGHASLRDRFAGAIGGGEDSAGAIAISIITLAELRYGAAYSAHAVENHRAIDDFVSGLTVLGVTPEAAGVFGDIKADLRRKGSLIEDLDLLIAATASAYDLALVTSDEGHFSRIPGLRLENWVGSP